MQTDRERNEERIRQPDTNRRRQYRHLSCASTHRPTAPKTAYPAPTRSPWRSQASVGISKKRTKEGRLADRSSSRPAPPPPLHAHPTIKTFNTFYFGTGNTRKEKKGKKSNSKFHNNFPEWNTPTSNRARPLAINRRPELFNIRRV